MSNIYINEYEEKVREYVDEYVSGEIDIYHQKQQKENLNFVNVFGLFWK